MKTLKIILVVLILLVGGFFIWMYTIPAEYKVERSAVLEADQDMVYGYVSNFETWPEWSSWFENDPSAKVTFGEIKAGEGASYSWEGEKMGKGRQSIMEAVPSEYMKTNIKFEGMGEADSYWKFEPTEDGKTKVTWGFGGELPLYARFMKYGIEKGTAPDFEEGLANLKEKLESMPRAPKIEISTVEVQSMPYYSVSHDISWDELSTELFSTSYEKISTYLDEDAENIMAPVFAYFHTPDEEDERVTVEPAIAATSSKPGSDDIIKGESYAGPAIKAVHVGGYNTEAEHVALHQYIEENGLQIAGPAWEVYVVNPSDEPDTSKWVTEIYYPIATDEGDSES